MAQVKSNRRAPFETPYAPEAKYIAQLRKYAQNISTIIQSFPQGDPAHLDAMRRAIDNYNLALEKWMTSTAINMIKETHAAQQRQWQLLAPKRGTVAAYEGRYHGKAKRAARQIQSERLDRRGEAAKRPI